MIFLVLAVFIVIGVIVLLALKPAIFIFMVLLLFLAAGLSGIASIGSD